MRLIRSLKELVRSWWSVDRIRVPASEGALLSAGPGCLLTVDGQLVEVVGRRVSGSGDCVVVIWECRTPAALARLRLELDPDSAPSWLSWTECGRTRLLHESDVTVWSDFRRTARSEDA